MIALVVISIVSATTGLVVFLVCLGRAYGDRQRALREQCTRMSWYPNCGNTYLTVLEDKNARQIREWYESGEWYERS